MRQLQTQSLCITINSKLVKYISQNYCANNEAPRVGGIWAEEHSTRCKSYKHNSWEASVPEQGTHVGMLIVAPFW